MKRIRVLQLLTAVTFTSVLAGGLLARQGTKMYSPDAKTMTIEGLVRDVACPIQNKDAVATNFSPKCVMDCVKGGSPLIILSKTGQIYFPISAYMPDSDQHPKLMPYVGKYVQATGTVFERDGTRAIAITDIKELKNVHLVTSDE